VERIDRGAADQSGGFVSPFPDSRFFFLDYWHRRDVSANTSAADNFVVPGGTDVEPERVTLFAYQSSQTTPSVQSIKKINLWNATTVLRRDHPRRCRA